MSAEPLPLAGRPQGARAVASEAGSTHPLDSPQGRSLYHRHRDAARAAMPRGRGRRARGRSRSTRSTPSWRTDSRPRRDRAMVREPRLATAPLRAASAAPLGVEALPALASQAGMLARRGGRALDPPPTPPAAPVQGAVAGLDHHPGGEGREGGREAAWRGGWLGWVRCRRRCAPSPPAFPPASALPPRPGEAPRPAEAAGAAGWIGGVRGLTSSAAAKAGPGWRGWRLPARLLAGPAGPAGPHSD